MQELVQQILDHARAMWHRRWIGLTAAWLVAIVGLAVVYKIPEQYEASARVYVDTESLLRPLLAGLAVQPNLDQQVALISRTLISRPNVEKLVRMADLDLRVRSNEERDSLISRVIGAIKLDGNVSSNLYIISYRDPNPTTARKVVQSLLEIFVESSLGDKRTDTQTAVKFLDEQIKSYQAKLSASENRLKDFRLKYLGVANQGSGDYFARATQMQSAIEAARLDVQAAEQARDSYKKQLAEGIPAAAADDADSAASDLASPVLDARIAALKKDLDALLLKYTDQFPDVVSTRRLIARLEDERRADIAARRKALVAKGPAAAAADDNPVVQQFRMALAESDATLASAKAKLAGLESQYRALKAQAEMVPQIEAEFTQLNRDYGIQKQTYDTLVARRESALMGKDVQDSGGAQFRVIDPPRVSPQPVAPNRLALLGIVFALALAAGLGASLLLSQVMPTFHDARTLREVTKRPILGMVSMLPNESLQRSRRRNSWLFAGGLSGLFAAFAAVFAFVLLIGRAA